MIKRRSRRIGTTTLAIVVATTLAFILSIGFLVFRLGNIFGSQQESSTAIDAAALEAANLMAHVVVYTNIGPIAAIDLPRNDRHPMGAIGLDKALATARLDYYIAKDLGNTTMECLAIRDIQYIQQTVAAKLVTEINNEIYLAPGGLAPVFKTFFENAHRDFRCSTANTKFGIEFGSGPGVTDIPVADPNDYTGNIAPGDYVAGYGYPVANGVTAVFSPVGDQPALTDNSQFVPFNAQRMTMLPTLVQLTATTTVVDTAPHPDGSYSQPETLISQATAICGGPPIAPISSAYLVGLRSGFPASSQNTATGQLGSSFDTLQNIMNSSQVDTTGSQGPAGIWGALPSQTWYKAGDGIVTVDDTTADLGFPTQPLVADNLSLIGTTTTQQNPPSVALTIGIYDWLRSNGLRVGRYSIEAALSANLRNIGTSQVYYDNNNPSGAGSGSTGSTSQTPPPYNAHWLQTASSPSNDPRYLSITTPINTQTFWNQVGCVSANTEGDPACAAVLIDQNGAHTVDGNPYTYIPDLQTEIVKTYHASQCVNAAATNWVNYAAPLVGWILDYDAAAAALNSDNAVLSDPTSSPAAIAAANADIPIEMNRMNVDATNINNYPDRGHDKWDLAFWQALLERATNCQTNSNNYQTQCTTVQSKFQVLTAAGVNEADSKDFTLAGNPFTSRDTITGDNSFIQPYTPAQYTEIYNAIFNATSDSDPSLADGSSDYWSDATAPICYAVPSSLPVVNNATWSDSNVLFLLTIAGDYENNQAPSNSLTYVTPLLGATPVSPFSQNIVSPNQEYYIAPNSLVTSDSSTGTTTTWTAVAVDDVCSWGELGTFSNAAQPDCTYCHGTTYDLNLPAGPMRDNNDCPTLAGEFFLCTPTVEPASHAVYSQSVGPTVVPPVFLQTDG